MTEGSQLSWIDMVEEIQHFEKTRPNDHNFRHGYDMVENSQLLRKPFEKV